MPATVTTAQPAVQTHIGVLDGVRSIAVIGVAAYHIWQQSWLQYVGSDYLHAHGLPYPNFVMNFIIAGDVQVDILLLLSAFLLTLPYARVLCGTAVSLPSAGQFYRRRVARIVPSAYFCLLVAGVLTARPAQYGSMAAWGRDLLSHLLFANVYSADTYYGTRLPGVLWTLSVEVAFYLVFPLLGRAFTKQPLLVWGGMLLCYGGYYLLVAQPAIQGGSELCAFNPLAFLPLYANGMLAAWGYAALEKRRPQDKWLTPVATLLFCGSVWLLYRMICVDYLLDTNHNQGWRLRWRFAVALCGGIMLVALCFSVRFVRAVFANRITHWFAGISFNFYLWHQTLALWFKDWRIPWYPDAPADAFAWPQGATGEPWHAAWQWQYTALCWGLGIGVAVLCTRFIEKPAARLINTLGVKK